MLSVCVYVLVFGALNRRGHDADVETLKRGQGSTSVKFKPTYKLELKFRV